MMATIKSIAQFKLFPPARWLVIAATALAKHTSLRIPHHWIVAVTNRSWSMRIGDGSWQRVKINSTGRVIA
jgi:hypothetical protein